MEPSFPGALKLPLFLFSLLKPPAPNPTPGTVHNTQNSACPDSGPGLLWEVGSSLVLEPRVTGNSRMERRDLVPWGRLSVSTPKLPPPQPSDITLHCPLQCSVDYGCPEQKGRWDFSIQLCGPLCFWAPCPHANLPLTYKPDFPLGRRKLLPVLPSPGCTVTAGQSKPRLDQH